MAALISALPDFRSAFHRAFPEADQPLRQRSTSAACQAARAIMPTATIQSSGIAEGGVGECVHRPGLVGRLTGETEPGQLDRQPGDEQVHDPEGDQPDPGEVLEGVTLADLWCLVVGVVVRGRCPVRAHAGSLGRDGQQFSVARPHAAPPAEQQTAVRDTGPWRRVRPGS